MQRSLRIRATRLLVISLLSCAPALGQQDVLLKQGTILTGKTRLSKVLSSDRKLQGKGDNGYYRIIDLRYKQYYVPTKFVEKVSQGNTFRNQSFKIKHKTVAGKRIPDHIGSYANVTPFDSHGVRTVTLRTATGPKRVIQGISELTPEYAWIKSLDHRWQFGLPTTSLDDDTLSKVLREAIDFTDPTDRLAVCQYLIAARKLDLAAAWIADVQSEFPAFKKQCTAASLRLRQRYAEKVVIELSQRKRAGQHDLVQRSLSQFPSKDISQTVLNSVENLQKEYKARQTAIDTIHDHLEKLEAAVEPKLAERVKPLREELRQKLGFNSLDRLQAYINLSKDKTLKPRERLSIAYSGWLLGSSAAVTNIEETLGLWTAQEHIAAVLNTDDPLTRRKSLDALDELEGVTAKSVVRLLQSSPPLPPNTAVPGQFVPIEAETEIGLASYKVVLPPEYSPYKDYPLIVTLRQANLQTADALQWWAGTAQNPLQAQRRGYIVIAPEYLEPGTVSYTSNEFSHEIVLASIRDAFKRFSVDTDRVYLTGHGSGADATFDIGMSHPDLFAGAIPICGFVGPECAKLTTNGSKLPWYVVTGQRHRDALNHNRFVLHQIAIAKKNANVIVCEYKERGFENYYDEIQTLFKWMESLSRPAMPQRFEVATVRPESNQWYWVEASGFPPWLADQDFTRAPNGKNRLRGVEFNLRALRARNTIQINRAGADKVTLRLMDDVISFDKTIRVEGRGIARGGRRIDPKPVIEDVLTDFRIYRDRNRIALKRLEL